MKNNLNISVLFCILLIHSVVESSAAQHSPIKIDHSGVNLISAFGSQASFDLSPLKTTQFGQSFGGISSGFTSPEEALRSRAAFKEESPKIKSPCPPRGDGRITPVCRAAIIDFLRNTCRSSQREEAIKQGAINQDDRQPEEGQVVKKLSTIESLKKSLAFWKSASWKDRLFNSISKNNPEFEFRDLGPNKVQMHIDCEIGVRSLFAHSINGKPNTKDSSCDELTERWFACATVEEISPGVYKTVVKTPNTICFEQVGGTGLNANETSTHESKNLPVDQHSKVTFLSQLSPLHANYGE